MFFNKVRKCGALYDQGRGAGRGQKPPLRERMRVSAKFPSPGGITLQHKTDGANDVTVWLKGLSMVAMKECLTIGRIVEELEYRLAEDVVQPNFATIEDDADRYIASQIYLTKIEKNLNVLAEIEKEKPQLYTITEANISERSET